MFARILCCLPFLAAMTVAAETNSVTLPPREKLHLYLLMGQSNMAGRGKVAEVDRTSHPRVISYSLEQKWVPAVEPITHDKPTMLGVGPGLSFGKAMAEHDKEFVIGLVPCAVGGTPLRRWEQGGDLYSNAVHRAKLAMKDGVLMGVIWHQGESDSGQITNASTYGARLEKMIQALRTDLNSPNLPFVVGELGEFLVTKKRDQPSYVVQVIAALDELPQKVPHTACASAKGLKDKGDVLHFNAESQREFGKRYAEKMIQLTESK